MTLFATFIHNFTIEFYQSILNNKLCIYTRTYKSGKFESLSKFYKFISSYVRDAKDHSITNELYNTSSANDFFAVLDGQQRLTAMRIGIYGSYSYHEPRKSWTYSNSSFPSRHMYLCLSKTGSNNDDCQYFFMQDHGTPASQSQQIF